MITKVARVPLLGTMKVCTKFLRRLPLVVEIFRMINENSDLLLAPEKGQGIHECLCNISG